MSQCTMIITIANKLNLNVVSSNVSFNIYSIKRIKLYFFVLFKIKQLINVYIVAVDSFLLLVFPLLIYFTLHNQPVIGGFHVCWKFCNLLFTGRKMCRFFTFDSNNNKTNKYKTFQIHTHFFRMPLRRYMINS